MEGTAGDNPSSDGFEWAIVEIFGHRRHAGRAREEERFGAKMLRIDVPTFDPDVAPSVLEWGKVAFTTHWYGGSSIFSYTLTDEASVVRINRPYAAASRYLAPPISDEDAEEPFG